MNVFEMSLLLALLLSLSIFSLFRLFDAANEVDWGPRWLNRIDGFIRLLCRHFHRLSPSPIVLPDRGAAILVSNHVSGLDALALIAATKRPLRFLIAREEYERRGLHWVLRAAGCIPVDRENRPERAYREALRALASGEVVAVFPHGGIRWPVNPHTPLKAGAVQLAQRSKSLLYPVYIDGIKGKGRNISAILMRSNLSVKSFPAIDCTHLEVDEGVRHLAQLLNK
jgi:1-acyl-sn-glycerol-3-phosphate acyltransferase